MALWYCRGCTAAYAVGLKACPQCGASDPVRRRDDLPRVVDAEASTTSSAVGPAENLTTGEVTPAGQPLPEIPAEADAVELEPTPPARASRRRKASGG